MVIGTVTEGHAMTVRLFLCCCPCPSHGHRGFEVCYEPLEKMVVDFACGGGGGLLLLCGSPSVAFCSGCYPEFWALCSAKNTPRSGHVGTLHCQQHQHRDTLHYQKHFYFRAWKHFALPKSPPVLSMGTLCTAINTPISGHRDTLRCQKSV